MKKVITRFPPSPTGSFHVGSARTALFNYLYAKKHGGEFILRFEDTDVERSKSEYELDILNGLVWLGLEHDNHTVSHQSERTEVYTKHLTALLESGMAYEGEPNTDNTGNVIRFKNPNKEISFEDEVRGIVTFDTTDLGDFVIARSIDAPLYHLTVVVDDHDMNITHVIRGEDNISNTPRQILLQEALGFERPVYAHIPLILGADRSKLSKRHGAVSVNMYKEQGYLADAFVNFLALLGWHPKGEKEVFTQEELINAFELTDVQKGGAIFDEEKLRWLNKEHLRALPDAELLEALEPYHPYGKDALHPLLAVVRDRITTVADLGDMVVAGELAYFFEAPAYTPSALAWKEDSLDDVVRHIEVVVEILINIPDNNFDASSIKEAVWGYATEEGRGSVLWPMRYALSGRDKSPDPFQLAEVLGKKETIARLQNAVHEIQNS